MWGRKYEMRETNVPKTGIDKDLISTRKRGTSRRIQYRRTLRWRVRYDSGQESVSRDSQRAWTTRKTGKSHCIQYRWGRVKEMSTNLNSLSRPRLDYARAWCVGTCTRCLVMVFIASPTPSIVVLRVPTVLVLTSYPFLYFWALSYWLLVFDTATTCKLEEIASRFACN